MKKRNLKKSFLAIFLVIAMLVSQMVVLAGDGPLKRSQIDDKYKWDLEAIYPTYDAWNRDFKKISDDYIPKMNAYKGQLNSAKDVLDCFSLSDEMMRLLEKVYVYALMKLDENNADNDVSEMASKAESLNSQVMECAAFIQPELLGKPESEIKAYINDPKFADYKHSLEVLLDTKVHTLSKEEEELLAKASIMAGTPNDVYNKVKSADMTFGKIKNEEGEWVQLTNASYGSFLDSKDRKVRKDAFNGVFRSYDKLKNTFASALIGEVNKNIFFAQARKYDSALEASLASESIPRSVYDNLVKAVNNNVSYLHKYISLRKQMLNLDKVHLYDMYVSLIDTSYNTDIPYETACAAILEGLKPLGADYTANVSRGLSSRWIDVYETENKYSGAYSWGTYDTQPYILMNYDKSLDSMLTLAHEMGHSLNSYYTNKTQKYVNSVTPIFTAEVASTTNEFLMYDLLLKMAQNDDQKLFLINSLIENIRGTVYTQVMYAEFEQSIHERVEAGEALSAKTLKQIWGNLMTKYYGTDFYVDDYATLWWARIPHFYMNFYVYKYATSMAASNEIVKNIKAGDEASVTRYLDFLKAGSSDYPIEVLKKAGVDMTSTAPVDNLLAEFGKLVGQMEAILKNQGKLK